MASRDDDVGALFRSLGTGEGGFRDLARDADAREAENRWPLLRSMPLVKRALTPALSSSQKQAWSRQEAPESLEPVSSSALPRLAQKLANSLRQMSGHATQEQAVAVKPAVRAGRDDALAQPAQDFPLFGKKSQPEPRPSMFARPSAPATRTGVRQFANLFANPDATPATFAPRAAAKPGRDSLGSVFKRIEEDGNPPPRGSGARSFLGRPGRG